MFIKCLNARVNVGSHYRRTMWGKAENPFCKNAPFILNFFAFKFFSLPVMFFNPFLFYYMIQLMSHFLRWQYWSLAGHGAPNEKVRQHYPTFCRHKFRLCYFHFDACMILQKWCHFLHSGWSRVLYSTEVKLFPWIPEFVITFLTKTALIEVNEALIYLNKSKDPCGCFNSISFISVLMNGAINV